MAPSPMGQRVNTRETRGAPGPTTGPDRERSPAVAATSVCRGRLQQDGALPVLALSPLTCGRARRELRRRGAPIGLSLHLPGDPGELSERVSDGLAPARILPPFYPSFYCFELSFRYSECDSFHGSESLVTVRPCTPVSPFVGRTVTGTPCLHPHFCSF